MSRVWFVIPPERIRRLVEGLEEPSAERLAYSSTVTGRYVAYFDDFGCENPAVED
jgi:hypothetical protein